LLEIPEDIVYLIDYSWWDQWEQYVSQTKEHEEERKEESSQILKPSMIENEFLHNSFSVIFIDAY